MKFNIHHWNGQGWIYIATAMASDEQEAAKMIASRFTLKGRFAAYPHIDTYNGQVTSKSSYTVIE